MAKNIVLLLDGTSNEISTNRSNILRLYGVLEKSEKQIVYYDPGVGTFGAENAWSQAYRKAAQIWGMATGWGLDANVKEAYRFLMQHYDDGKRPDKAAGERDRIYIFGFSRGAYTARVLAGFLHAGGLLSPINDNLLDYAYRAYKRIGENQRRYRPGPSAEAENTAFEEMRLYERILRPDRPPIRLLGLFDTVPSVIEAGRFGPRLRSHAFTRTNRSVEAVRHAVAIEEKRTMFQPQLWPARQTYLGNPFNTKGAKPQDVREVWFTGVHGDVGGGYPEPTSGLAKIPLAWMVEQTGPMGLQFNPSVVNALVLGKNPKKAYVKPDLAAALNISMNWAWAIMEFVPRRVPRDAEEAPRRSLFGLYVPFFQRRIIPPGAVIHKSVLERAKLPGNSAPANIPAVHEVEG